MTENPDSNRPAGIVGMLGKATTILVALTTLIAAASALVITLAKGSDQVVPVFRHVFGGGATTAANIDAGPCGAGYVLRLAGPTDTFCVTPVARQRTARENAQASLRWDPAAGYGPYGCKTGYVWRDAFVGDKVCVVPDVRDLVREDNRLAASRRAIAKREE